jgi:GNAT superfamily N-acetyltransferase
MNPIEFITSPTTDDLHQIRRWLEEEDAEFGHSFLCNWRIIEESFEDSRFVCARVDNEAVAFFTWSPGPGVVTALIAAVRPDLRKRGIGSNLVQHAFSYLRSKKRVVVIEAECKPTRSESFWRQQGFISYPQAHSMAKLHGIHLYKSLINERKSKLAPVQVAHLELWHKQPFEVSPEDKPDVSISIRLNRAGKFSQKIALPAESDWNARVSVEGNLPREGKVKYLFSHSCRKSGFIVGVPALA